MSFQGRMEGFIERHSLLGDGWRLLIALSGGPDSVALMHALCRLRRRHRWQLSAVYINHNIRPRSARREERFCAELCERMKVDFLVERADVPAMATRRRISVEEAARDFRYDTFERLAREHNFDRVVLGHHADDQVETILFRLVRGTGPSGLVGMPVRRGLFVRPLLEHSKAEILEYLKTNNLAFCRDASNDSSQYSRNFIRNRVLPVLRERLNPKVDRAILGLADTLAVDEAFLEEETDRAARRCLAVTPGGKFNLDLEMLAGYPAAIRHRLLRRCLRATWQTEANPDKATVERVVRLIENGSGATSLPNRVRAEISGGRLWLIGRSSRKVDAELVPGRKLELEWPAVNISGRLVERSRVRLPDRTRRNRAVLDWSSLRPPMTVRTIRTGDKFGPLGMKGHKKVGDFLTDHKAPRPLRDEILLLCDQVGIVWIVGYEIAARVRVSDNTEKVLSLAVNIGKKKGRPAV